MLVREFVKQVLSGRVLRRVLTDRKDVATHDGLRVRQQNRKNLSGNGKSIAAGKGLNGSKRECAMNTLKERGNVAVLDACR